MYKGLVIRLAVVFAEACLTQTSLISAQMVMNTILELATIRTNRHTPVNNHK